MTKKELIDKMKDMPDDAEVVIYCDDPTIALRNIFVKDAVLENYEDSGMIIDLYI